jgi:hypothetical protein
MNTLRSLPLLLLLFAPCTPEQAATPLSPPEPIAASAPALADVVFQNCSSGTVPRGNRCVPLRSATDAEVRDYLVRQSIRAYSGNCPCPYNVDRAGRRCGGRSAYSRPGGAAPLCYASDVSDAAVRRARGE